MQPGHSELRGKSIYRVGCPKICVNASRESLVNDTVVSQVGKEWEWKETRSLLGEKMLIM